MLNKLLLLLIIIYSNIAFANNISSNSNVAGITSLMNAVMNNDIDGVKFFSTKEQEMINKQNIGGATALHLSARSSNPQITKILLENGAQVNIKDNSGWTAIMRASANCKIENAKLLINFGANIFFNNNNDESAILYATNSKCLELISKFKEISLLKYSFIKLLTFKKNIQKSIYIASRSEDAKIKKELEQILSHLNNLYNVKALQKDKMTLKKPANDTNLEQKIYKNSKNINTLKPIVKKNNNPINNISIAKESKISTSNNGQEKKFKFKKINSKKPQIIQIKEQIKTEKIESSNSIKNNIDLNNPPQILYSMEDKLIKKEPKKEELQIKKINKNNDNQVTNSQNKEQINKTPILQKNNKKFKFNKKPNIAPEATATPKQPIAKIKDIKQDKIKPKFTFKKSGNIKEKEANIPAIPKILNDNKDILLDIKKDKKFKFNKKPDHIDNNLKSEPDKKKFKFKINE
ncbi:ankyrin repeat domain-containing protein [Rickettsiales bacterium]|nr:ankyrin repeat domain-containing protein [Rickettsiales bacterium]